MALPLSGKVALITGSSKGVGRGIALELARHGATIVVNYNSDQAGALATLEAVNAFGAPGMIVKANVGDSADITAMFETVKASLGRVDILVNNAGVQTWKALLDVTEAEWDYVLDVNLKGSFLCTQQAATLMKAQGGGRSIHIGSG